MNTDKGALKWAHVMSIGLKSDFTLELSDLPVDVTAGNTAYVAWTVRTAPNPNPNRNRNLMRNLMLTAPAKSNKLVYP